MNIFRPTYNRSNNLKGVDYFKGAKYVICEKQKDDYLKVLDNKNMVIIPDDDDGSISKKRNWMLKNLPRPYVSIDDDINYILMMEGRSKEKSKFIQYKMIDREIINDVFIHYTNLAYQLECKMWGVMQRNSGDEREYKEFKPFTLKNVVLGPFHCHLEHTLLYDENMLAKEDYDMAIQQLNKYRKILRVDKLAIKGEQATNQGGIVSMRSLDYELEGAKRIMNKWGSNIIKYNLEPKKINDVISGRVNIPINGV